jgi:hypothetical protein
LAGENNDNIIGKNEEPEKLSEETIDEIRKSFRVKRIALEKMLEEYSKNTNNATNDFDRLTNKGLVIDAKLLRNLTIWIETLIISNVGLKKQIDILKDILVQLPDVKGHPVIMKDIEEAFKDYDHSNI